MIRGKLVCLPQCLQEKCFVYFCTSFFFLMFGGVSFPHQSDLSLRQLTHECCGSHLHTLVMGRKNHQMVRGNVAMLVGEHCELSIAMLDCWWLTSSCLCLEPIPRSKSFGFYCDLTDVLVLSLPSSNLSPHPRDKGFQ